MVKSFSPHRPFPKQEAWLRLDAEEALYGGAAGGGKSDADLFAALQYIDVPGYSAAIFRRTNEDAEKPDSILYRARRWFAGTAARWDEKSNSFLFPTMGEPSSIHFGYAKTLTEVTDRYAGPSFQYICVEELQQWQEEVYLFLFSRLRRLTGGVPLRMRANCNPGGRGQKWIRARFIDHARHVVDGRPYKEVWEAKQAGEPMPELPYFESPPSSEAAALAAALGRKAQGAFFVPAFAEDNPGLDWNEYRFQLLKLDPVTRAQLEKGNWWISTGGKLFRPEWFRIMPAASPGLITARSWDLAATKPRANRKDPDWSAGVRGGVERMETGSVLFWLTDARRCRENPGDTELFVKRTADQDGRAVDVWFEEEPGSAGKNNTHNYASRILRGHTVHGFRKTGPKIEYWRPVSADASNDLIRMVAGPWNAEVIAELCALTEDDTHEHDDYADAIGTLRAVLLDDGGLSALESWQGA